MPQIYDFARKEIGVTAKKFYTIPKILITGSLEVMEKYGIDVPFVDYDIYNIEAEALGQTIIYSDDRTPEVDRSELLIQDRSDLNKIKTPDFNSDRRFPLIIEMYSLFRKLTGIEPVLQFCAPFFGCKYQGN